MKKMYVFILSLILGFILLRVNSPKYSAYACVSCHPSPTSSCPRPTATNAPTPTTCHPSPTPTIIIVPTSTPTPTTTEELPSPTPTPSTEPSSPTNTPVPTTPPSSGGGDGGSSTSGSGGGSSWSCSDPAPKIPLLASVVRINATTVELKWWSVDDPVSYYGISYGPSSRNYLYGQTNIGKVTSYRVGSLNSFENYCFVINAVNNCASSAFSNEICTVSSGSVLGAVAPAKTSTTKAKPKVKGLSKTGSGKWEDYISYSLGAICVFTGFLLIKPRKKLLLSKVKNSVSR